MGTGKTVQVLALLSALLKKSGTDRDKKELYKRKKLANEWTSKEEIRHTELLQQGIAYRESDAPPLPNYLPSWAPVLILAPSSILNNWITDGDRWGYFAMNDYVAKNDYTGVDHIRTGASEVLLVSHKLFEMENHFAALNKIPWKLVIVDEHHKLKNYKSKAAINLRTLRDTHCVPVIGLTGTVMQNDHRGKDNSGFNAGLNFWDLSHHRPQSFIVYWTSLQKT
jgi:SNF2 family DNA or RNA helicase